MKSSDSNNFLELINEFTRELSRPGITVEALCQFATIRTLKFLNSKSTFINKLDSDGMVRTVTSCGLTQDLKESWSEFPFSDVVPSNDAMRTNEIVWLADSADWNNFYPDISKFMVETDFKTFVAIPVDIPGAAVASIGIMSLDIHKQTRETNSFLWTISSLMSLFFANSINDIPALTLTSRQLEILTLISKNYTNRDIAEELGYSDSTIRHETMKIYENFKVTGRKEAVAKGIALNLIKKN